MATGPCFSPSIPPCSALAAVISSASPLSSDITNIAASLTRKLAPLIIVHDRFHIGKSRVFSFRRFPFSCCWAVDSISAVEHLCCNGEYIGRGQSKINSPRRHRTQSDAAHQKLAGPATILCGIGFLSTRSNQQTAEPQLSENHYQNKCTETSAVVLKTAQAAAIWVE